MMHLDDPRLFELEAFGNTPELRDALERAVDAAPGEAVESAHLAGELIAHGGRLEEAAIPVASFVAAELSQDVKPGLIPLLLLLLQQSSGPRPGILPCRAGFVGGRPYGGWLADAHRDCETRRAVRSALARMSLDPLVRGGLAAVAAFAESAMGLPLNRTVALDSEAEALRDLALVRRTNLPTQMVTPLGGLSDYTRELRGLVEHASRAGTQDLTPILLAPSAQPTEFPWCDGLKSGFAAQVLIAAGRNVAGSLLYAISERSATVGGQSELEDWDEAGLLAHLLISDSFSSHRGRRLPLGREELTDAQTLLLYTLDSLDGWEDFGGSALGEIGIASRDLTRVLNGAGNLDEVREGSWESTRIARPIWHWLVLYAASWAHIKHDHAQLVELSGVVGEVIAPASPEQRRSLLTHGLASEHVAERAISMWTLAGCELDADDLERLQAADCETASLALVKMAPRGEGPGRPRLPWLSALANALRQRFGK